MTLALRAYVALSHLLAPVWHLGLKHRLRRGKETPRSVHQKLGHEYADRPGGPLVWGHAVGVGEAMALAGLFARLAQSRPDVRFLITTTARTSGDALRRTGLPPAVQHQFAPADTPGAVRRFLDHWRPDLAVWCEMDLWPTLIDATAARGIPRVLVNARLSDASMARRRRGRWIYRALLPGFDRLFAQNETSAAHLVALGADPSQVTVSGTIKSLTPPLACDADDLAAWLAALRTRPVWLLASSHPGEEALALQAHQRLRERHPDALLIIAPRAPAPCGWRRRGLFHDGAALGHVHIGDAFAFSHVQRAWARPMGDPFTFVWNALSNFPDTGWLPTVSQQLAIASLAGYVLVGMLVWRHRYGMAIFSTICLTLPLFAGMASMLRFVAGLAPMPLMLAELLSTRRWLWLLAMPLAGYGFAWVGHFVFEKNRPATFQYPLWSFMGDWVMLKDAFTGRIRF